MIRRSSLRSLGPLLPLVLLTVACSSRSGDAGANEPRPADVEIVVDNQMWQDVTVYALSRGTRVRLGTVTALKTQRFTLPVALAGAHEFRLLADPVGSQDTITSELVTVEPGEIIEWQLANNLIRSVR